MMSMIMVGIGLVTNHSIAPVVKTKSFVGIAGDCHRSDSNLPLDKLSALAIALLNFSLSVDLDRWLESNG